MPVSVFPRSRVRLRSPMSSNTSTPTPGPASPVCSAGLMTSGSDIGVPSLGGTTPADVTLGLSSLSGVIDPMSRKCPVSLLSACPLSELLPAPFCGLVELVDRSTALVKNMVSSSLFFRRRWEHQVTHAYQLNSTEKAAHVNQNEPVLAETS